MIWLIVIYGGLTKNCISSKWSWKLITGALQKSLKNVVVPHFFFTRSVKFTQSLLGSLELDLPNGSSHSQKENRFVASHVRVAERDRDKEKERRSTG